MAVPYGIPWGPIEAYICTSCGREHVRYEYRPICGFCGAKQPEEQEARAQGLAVFVPTYGKRRTSDIPEINAFLQSNKGAPIRLWSYVVSHCELELRLRHSGGPNNPETPWLNTVIYCSGTDAIQVPTSEWPCGLIVESRDGPDGPICVLTDSNTDVRIECGSVALYFDVEVVESGL
jgi:hypothetical protein